jgi:lipoprotein-releasing system permease protein
MNGFETQLRERILGMTAHAMVLPFSEMLDNWPQVQSQLEGHPRIVGTAPFIEGEGMLRNGSLFSGVQIRGVDPAQEVNVSRVGEFMQQNQLTDLQAGEYGIVLGDKLAAALAVGVGEKVDLMIPKASLTPAGVVPRFRRFEVTGIFSADMYEYDRSLALVHLGDAQKLYRVGSQVTGLRLQFDDMFSAPKLRQEIEQQLQGPWFVSDWTRQHKNFFQAIATEKTVMFFILVLIIAVAAFNIVSALVMVVTDKQGDIAVLRTLGATPGTIMRIFMVQGFVIGALGTVLGVLGGVALALNVDVVVPFIERLAGRDLLSSDVYVISELNGELHAADVWRTAVVAFFLSWLSTLYPAWKASRIQPAEALRYE